MRTTDLIKRMALAALGGAIVFGAVAGAQQSAGESQPASDPQATDPTARPDAAEVPDFGAIRALMGAGGGGGGERDEDELPKFEEVSKGFRKIISTAEGTDSLYTLWIRDKDGQMLAELPRGFERQFHFIAMTVAGGDQWAGLQAGDRYFYWRRYNNRIAMIEPNLGRRTTGDQESKSSVDTIFTDRVILDLPIVAMGPGGQPVIDLDDLLVGRASSFFGTDAAGANTRLASNKKAKAFPENIEVAYEIPVQDGTLRTFHYSLSLIPENSGYKPRTADNRVGFFTTSYLDLGKFSNDEKWIRYVNRWQLEKADPKLKMSPPKEPIVFYIEHTVPVRYRRWVREGVLQWNRAFEQVGIANAVEVYYQDKSTGAHMDKDPEDRRYNFIRWLSNDVSTAIGPSRVNPKTGEILDADVVLTDGWIRAFWYQYHKTLPDIAMEGFSPETLEFLNANPSWDPRVRMAPPGQRDHVLAERARRGVLPYAGHPAAMMNTNLMGDEAYDGLGDRVSQMNGLCMASVGKAMDLAVARMSWDMFQAIGADAPAPTAEPAPQADDEPSIPPEVLEILRKKMAEGELPEGLPPEILAMLQPPPAPPEPAPAQEEQPKEEDKPKDEGKAPDDMIDGIPEWYIGPMLRELVAHEVGHTLGLRHNFAGSSTYTMEQINSDEVKGKTPWSSSVMDYNPHNINVESGPLQGDYAVIDIGPYDMWAIQYGYTPDDKDAKEALKRVAEPALRYATDEDTWGPDPIARRYDMSANPLDYARNQTRLAKLLRSKLLDRFVKEGEGWAKARQGYLVTLGMQTSSMSMMCNWIGGAHAYRDNKGDPNGRTPTQVVPAAMQREAIKFAIENSFYDDAFGLTPDMLAHLTIEKWFDEGGEGALFEDPTWPVHDRILGVQASVLTMLMNPTTLQRVYDNEFRTPKGEDCLTLPELLETVAGAVWTEVNGTPDGKFTAREPMISSLRRSLQREHTERLIDLSLHGNNGNAAFKPIADLATMSLRKLSKRIESVVSGPGAANVDPYTLSHLGETKQRIDRVLDAQFIANTEDIAPSINYNIPDLFGERRSPADR